MYTGYYDSPIGILEIRANQDYITNIKVVPRKQPENKTELILDCIKQLQEYFLNKRKVFTIPLLLEGTSFQKEVWRQLLKIPYGATYSYSEIAISIKKRKATRAVGGAISKNPIAILVPCHRVIGRKGSLTGYVYGLDSKRYLLELERSE